MISELPSFTAESPLQLVLSRNRIAPFRWHIRLVAIFFSCVSLAFCGGMPVYGAEWQSLTVGHQGITKVSCWTPVAAVATELPKSTKVALQCEFSDPRGDKFQQTVATGITDETGTISLEGYFVIGRQEGSGQISIAQIDDQQQLLRKTIAHSESVSAADRANIAADLLVHRLDVPFLMTYGQLAGIPELLDNAEQFSARQKLLQGLTLPAVADLPEDARGLQAVNMLVLADVFDCNERQAQAIQEWVISGGHLFVSAGSKVESLTANKSLEWLTTLLQIQSKPFSVRDLSSLQSYVAAADPGVTALRTRRARDGIQMAGFGSPETQVDVPSLNGPILGRQSLGSGVVRFIAVDVNQKPLSEWNSLPQFYEVLLLGEKLSASTTGQSRTARISQSGVSDLGSQLMSTVDSRSNSIQWSTWAVMGLVAVYLILIGPLDYLLVTLIFKRPSLTWITFPCWVLIGAGILFSLTSRSSDFQANHLNVIDVMPLPEGQAVKLRSWVSLRPNQTMKTDLQVSIDDSLTDMLTVPASMHWAGRPEDVFGGMYRVGGVGLGQRNYQSQSDTPNALADVPMLIDGSREFLIDAYANSKTSSVQSNLNVTGFGLLSGEVTNDLPFDLTDWIIVYGNRVYRPRAEKNEATIASQSTFVANSESMFASDLKSFLNASRLVLDQKQNGTSSRGATQVTTPYNKKSNDPMYILTMASFYETAGGYKYVGLGNSLLGNLDASDSIRLNHAVLIGVADVEATRIDVKGIDATTRDTQTFIRAFLPVTHRGSSNIAEPDQD
ncbi:MAG: hypothetical protein ABJZ55_16745 [Fuerstiella sp.]